MHADNLGIETYDGEGHGLRPILARGVHSERFMARDLLRDQGVASWVASHGVAQLVSDELRDARVVEPEPGAMVALTPAFTPAHLIGVTIDPKNALKFDFLIHKGDVALSDAQKREEYRNLIK